MERHSGCESVVELHKHLFHQTRPGLCPQELEGKSSFKACLWFAQPPRRLHFVAEDLFSQRRNPGHSYGAIRFIVSQRLLPGLSVNQSSARQDEMIDFFIAYSMAG